MFEEGDSIVNWTSFCLSKGCGSFMTAALHNTILFVVLQKKTRLFKSGEEEGEGLGGDDTDVDKVSVEQRGLLDDR
jgi:hypothetical protein